MQHDPKTTAAGSKARILSRPDLSRISRLIFVAALASILYFAWSPASPDVMGNDKSQHMLAFVVLTVLFRLAFPARGCRGALVWMGLLGALIELVQAIPGLHRDCDILDWFADMGAVLAALVATDLAGRIFRR